MGAGIMIQSVERAVMILQCFTRERPELRLTEIVEELDLHKSTAHGLLNTLKHYRLVEQDPDTQRYRLGLGLLDLSGALLDRMDIRKAAEGIIREVCRSTDETVHLVVLDGTDVVYIDKQESNQSIRITTSIGTRYPAYATGVGKAMLAYLPPEDVEKLLPAALAQLTNTTITDRQALMGQLADIRRRGYATDDEEAIEGLRCAAAPIFDHHDKVVAAISIAGPSVRMTQERLPELAVIVADAARRISARLGHAVKF